MYNPPRARRFNVELPIRHRALGETAWRKGRTMNISYTGVRFWTDRLMEVHTPIEVTLALPVAVGGKKGEEVILQAEVVRTERPASPNAMPSLAARILDHQFMRGHKRCVA